jgi:chromosome segregation ATPase
MEIANYNFGDMIVINIDRSSKKPKRREVRKPTVQVSVPSRTIEVSMSDSVATQERYQATPERPQSNSVQPISGDSPKVVINLYDELREIKVDREGLSSSIAEKVRQYQAGKLDVSELEKLYSDINALTKEGARVYKEIEHFQRYGSLPKTSDPEKKAKDSEDINELKVRKRSLENMRNKISKKLELARSGAKKPQNPMKVAEWEMQMIEYDSEWEEIRTKINDLDGD